MVKIKNQNIYDNIYVCLFLYNICKTCIYIYVYIYVYIYKCVYIYMYMYIYICICIYVCNVM